jgi:hypothetical protein
MFIVVESRIWMLDARTSNLKLPVHRTGLPGDEISFILRSLYPALAGGTLAGRASCFDMGVVTHNRLTINQYGLRNPNLILLNDFKV